MAKITIFFALALIALGLIGYFGTPVADSDNDKTKSAAVEAENEGSSAADSSEASAEDKAEKKPAKRSITAMIPSFVGVVLLLFGVVGLKESLRKHAMHGAVLIGLLGFLAGGSRVAMSLNKVFGSDEVPNWRSFTFVFLMTLICAVFVAVCVNSFIQARKQQKEEKLLAQRQAEN